MPSQYKVFPNQASADDINTRLPQGISINLEVGPQDILIKPKLAIDSIIANTSLDQADQDFLTALPEIGLPTEEETNFIAGAPIGSWSFVLEGSANATEKFMTQATKMALPSDLTPAILPANLHLVSMSFINEIDNANCEIKIHLGGSVVYTWSLTSCRWAVKTAQSAAQPLMVLPEMGLISASIISDLTPNAKDGILTLYFRLVGDASPGEFINATL